MNECEEQGIEFHIVDLLHRIFEDFMYHSSRSSAQDEDRFRSFMGKHGEVYPIFQGSHIGDRSRDGWDAIGVESELLTPLGDRDVSIDGVLMMSDVETSPLRLDGGQMDLMGQGAQ